MNKEEIKKNEIEMARTGKQYEVGTNEYLVYHEMLLRNMIMSCLCYGDDIYNSEYTLKYKDILGEEKFDEVMKNQEEYFKTRCKVESCVYTDCEGITYNTIIEM